MSARQADPGYFPDLSLCVIKLLGRGEYVVEFPGGTVAGHFGLAVADYAHSTAPNRRFPDMIIQRLLKAALTGAKPPYRNEELTELARHCTEQEDAAKKVERQVVKSAGAMLLIGKDRGEVRRDGHGRLGEGHLGPHFPSPDRGEADQGIREQEGWRPACGFSSPSRT